MNYNQKIVFGIVILCAVFVAAYLFPHLFPESSVCTINGVCQHEVQLNELEAAIPIIIAAALGIGALVYYLMSQKLVKKENTLKSNSEIILKLLNPEERKIVDFLLKENGKCYQSEISRIEGIGKLRSHRILQKLSDRNVVEIEKHGKTNIVRFSKDLMAAFFEK